MDTYVKESITINKKPAGAGNPNLAYDFIVPNGYTLIKNPDGSVSVYDIGFIDQFIIQRPNITDSSGTIRNLDLIVSNNNLSVSGDFKGLNYPATIDPIIKITAKSAESILGYRRMMGRTSDGALWVTFQFGKNVSVSTSTNNGNTWSLPPTIINDTPMLSQIQYSPVLAVDSNDNVHVAWHGSGYGTHWMDNEIYYKQYTGGAWGAQEAVTDLNCTQANPATYPSLIVDSNDVPHIGFMGKCHSGDTAENLPMYVNRSGGTWGSIEEVAYTTLSTGASAKVTLLINSTGSLYFVFSNQGFYANSSDYNIKYRIRTNGVYSQIYNVTDWGLGTNPVHQTSWSAVMGIADDNLHVVYRSINMGPDPATPNLFYQQIPITGNFIQGVAILPINDTSTGGRNFNSITINASNQIDMLDNVIFEEQNPDEYYVEQMSYTGSWSNSTKRTNTAATSVVIHYNRYPEGGLYNPVSGWLGLLQNDTALYFINSTDLSWGTAGAAPVAAFSCTPIAGVRNSTRTCTDASTNTPTSWDWFGAPSNPCIGYNTSTQSPNIFPINYSG